MIFSLLMAFSGNIQNAYSILPTTPDYVLTISRFIYEYRLLFIIWDVIWRGLALWKASRRNEKIWFIALFIVNSLGILPIVYLLFTHYREKSKKG